MSESTDESTFIQTLPTLLGVRIAERPPIEEIFLSLDKGLLVLYGRNGVGKSNILNAVREAIGPVTVISGTRDLIFKWPPPEAFPKASFRYHEDLDTLLTAPDPLGSFGPFYDDARWQELQCNPWTSFPDRHDLPDRHDDGERYPDIEDWLDLFDTFMATGRLRSIKQLRYVDTPLSRVARFIAFDSEVFATHDDEDTLLVLNAAVEIAARGYFTLTTGSPYRTRAGQQERTLRSAAPASELLPHLKTIVDRVTAHMRATEGEQDYGTSPCDASLGLRLGTIGCCFETLSRSRLLPVPPWFGDAFPATGLPVTESGPAELVDESDFDLPKASEAALVRNLGIENQPRSLLLRHDDETFALHPDLDAAVRHLQTEAARVLALLLEDAPELICRVRDPREWAAAGVVDWSARDKSGAVVPLSLLSRAQQRWATFSVRVALHRRDLRLPLVILLDEPEAALHRRGERFLARGLAQLAEELNATIVTATHSPSFLGLETARLVHVDRDANGMTVVSEMQPTERARLDRLGLEPADLLQYCRVAVLVEGQHELVILRELFDHELASMGAELFAMRGLKGLGAADAQLLFRFTDVPLLVVSDNEDSSRLIDIWMRACTARDAGDDALAVLRELSQGRKSAEAKFLQDFMADAIMTDERHRIRFHGMSLPDIPDYLPLHAIAPKAPDGASWAKLRAEFAASGTGQDFKKWMSQRYGATYTDQRLRAATRQLDSLHTDLTDLLHAVRNAAGY